MPAWQPTGDAVRADATRRYGDDPIRLAAVEAAFKFRVELTIDKGRTTGRVHMLKPSAEAGGGNIKPTCGEDSAAERQEPREKGEYQEGEDPARREGGIYRTRPRRKKRKRERQPEGEGLRKRQPEGEG